LYSSYFNKLKNGNNTTDGNTDKAISSLAGEDSAEQSTNSTSSTQEVNKKKDLDTIAEFMDYMKKSPAERLRADILKKLDLTEDDIKAMPPEKRAATEQKIAEEIKRTLEGDTKSSKSGELQSVGAYSNQKLSDGLNNALLQIQELNPITFTSDKAIAQNIPDLT